jgi:cardiolipin synthase
MLADIQSASRRIWLETYIFLNDAGGTRIADALKQKAREGLDVRVLYDAVGSVTTPAAFFNELRAAGVKVHAFHSLMEGFRHFRILSFLNKRDHRKLFIVDDDIGYFGGMNIADNADPNEDRSKIPLPSSSGWRDVHLRVKGPQQHELAESFERTWNRVHGIRSQHHPRQHARSDLLKMTGLPAGTEHIHFFDSGQHRFSRAARIYTRFFRTARFKILIAMAYFIPSTGLLRQLFRARKRRVHIRIVIPGKSDVPLAQRAAASLYDRLLRRGFRIFERNQRMLHSKLVVIDNIYTIVGSANLDARSLQTNLEFLAVIRSEKLASVMTRIVADEIAQSTRITTDRCRISTWQRFLNAMAWSLRSWL